MSFVVEALVSAAIGVLVEKLASTDLLQFARQEQIHADLDKWKKILLKIEAVLADAEEKQMTNRLVEIWLSELKNLAYDVEDVLDEFATEALRKKLLDEPQASTNKLRKLIPTCCTSLNPRSLKLNSTMASQIKEITARLQQIVKDKNDFDLKENLGARSNQDRYQNQRLPATSLNEPHIYGRDNDKDAILELLLKDEGTHAKFSVISIEGMGGIGKTTLVQLVYNDARVKYHFDIIVWTCVSDDFNVTQVTKTILQSIAPETGDVNDLNMLQVKLKEKLSGKKFFIVLDDVWNENYEKWTKLCLPFEGGSEGSKIVVTTRNHSVSLKVRALIAYPLKKLSYNHCLSVFTQHSLGKEDFSEHEYLEEIGKKIIEKCDGLPLAAKTLGGILIGKVSNLDWESVLYSNMWNLPQEENGIVPALSVSYYYLPSHLKRCFAYCSILPKDYVFQKEELILLWMAEGFLLTKSNKKQAEDLGDEYFINLHSRSFFQHSNNDASMFVMHDLINDLAQWAAKDFCFRIENLPEGEKQWKIPENLRHVSYLHDRSNYECIKKSGAFNEMKSVRTFLTLSPDFWFQDTSYDFLCMVLQLRHLRVLSLNGYPISELPNSIGDLKLLHHLNLSHTALEFLPDSINTLYNLETLILKNCYRIKRLCSDMGNLVKFRHLYISDAYRLQGMPLKFGKLTGLRTLQRFVVGKDMGSRLRELKDLTHLQESLHISGLENVIDFEDAEKADLNGKGGLKDLVLEWTCRNDGSNEKEIAAQVLEKLRPCQMLESLRIRGYGGATQFPKWLGDTYLSSLVSLTFQNCKNCAFLPSMGQLPLLKKLQIWNIAEIKSLGPEFYGHGYSTAPFQSLEEFDIWNLQEWRDWIPCGSGRNTEAFPRLQKLSIRKCSKLQGKLPEHLPSLESLSIEDCEQWTVSVPTVPKHCTIRISRCKEVVLSSIKDCSPLSLIVHLLSGISSHMFLAEGFAEGFSKEEKLDIVEYIEPTCFLKSEIHSLEELKSKGLLHSNDIRRSFLLEEEEKEIQQQELPGNFQYLILEDCKCTVKLEQALQSFSFLRAMSISYSNEIKFFPEAALPFQLRSILILQCNALQSLPEAWMDISNTSLETLSVRNCDSLTCIARVQLPPNLKQLKIIGCFNLVTLLDEEEVPSRCGNSFRLEYLENENTNLENAHGDVQDSKLESISKSYHGNTNLEHLYIEGCEKLETLPSGMNNLTSLQSLVIKRCPIASIPEGGFPTSLTSLVIEDTYICKSLLEWGLHRLTSLKELKITRCPDVMSFPQEEIGMVLPTSLTALHIECFWDMERLSSIAQNLTCLEYLSLFDCRDLKYLPDDGLPKSLKQLEIRCCPLLEERCEEGEGLYWPMISHLADDVSMCPF